MARGEKGSTTTSCSYNHRTEIKASRNMGLFYTKFLPKLG
ncbi:unnamed protein product [Acanthoscelides obtectus]|uniref:Uncharacterized protein n=2 Tax=Acanthoscelides obtectus TaxID=200917 RepID=A0A9P0PXS4_ACAOB|nr:unnamed protein product [Acanthoscelides obtectus]CAK1675377.1 hypothetical protein AOBTE_LOCUS30179 [Acanthoscelides obtectus]